MMVIGPRWPPWRKLTASCAAACPPPMTTIVSLMETILAAIVPTEPAGRCLAPKRRQSPPCRVAARSGGSRDGRPRRGKMAVGRMVYAGRSGVDQVARGGKGLVCSEGRGPSPHWKLSTPCGDCGFCVTIEGLRICAGRELLADATLGLTG